MNAFPLDQKLADDCFVLGELQLSRLLLMNNAGVAWFILVPGVSVHEIHEMAQDEQLLLLQEINKLSGFVKQHFDVDKLNVAAIGNIVQQLHVHVVGRSKSDYCWPDVVWGSTPPADYADNEVVDIVTALDQEPGLGFTAATD